MYIKVFVKPEARRERVDEMKDGVLHISVREPARGNHANKRVVEIVAAKYEVEIAEVKILSGHHSRGKLLVVNR